MKVVKIEMFDLFSAYYRVMDRAKLPEWDVGLAVEAQRRLKQLDWFLLEVQSREVAIARAGPDKPRQYGELLDEVQLLTEAFYYFAFRAMKMLQLLPSLPNLPTLKGFDAIGVRVVRNQLIEHPDFPTRGFQMGAERGPVLGLRFDSDPKEPKDAGLYANAIEFRENLLPRVVPYLALDPGSAVSPWAPCGLGPPTTVRRDIPNGLPSERGIPAEVSSH